MILCDSNILIYAINVRSPKHNQAQAFVTNHQSELVCAHQNILETLRVLTHSTYPHPMTLPDGIEATDSIVNNLKILSPTIETYTIAHELLQRFPNKSNHIFDLYLVATMLSHDISTIATDNTKDLALFEGISVFNPFTEKK